MPRESISQTPVIHSLIVNNGWYRSDASGKVTQWGMAAAGGPATDLLPWQHNSGYRPEDVVYQAHDLLEEGGICIAVLPRSSMSEKTGDLFFPIKRGTPKSEAAVLKRAHEVALDGLVKASRMYRAALDAHDDIALAQAKQETALHAERAQKLAKAWQTLTTTPSRESEVRRLAEPWRHVPPMPSSGELSVTVGQDQPEATPLSVLSTRELPPAAELQAEVPSHLLRLERTFQQSHKDKEQAAAIVAELHLRALGGMAYAASEVPLPTTEHLPHVGMEGQRVI